jgi:hypothetical protein
MLSGNIKKIDHLANLHVEGRKEVVKKSGCEGLKWLKIEFNGALL